MQQPIGNADLTVARADTLEELRAAAIDAIEAWVETRRGTDAERETDSEPLPRPYLTMDIPPRT